MKEKWKSGLSEVLDLFNVLMVQGQQIELAARMKQILIYVLNDIDKSDQSDNEKMTTGLNLVRTPEV